LEKFGLTLIYEKLQEHFLNYFLKNEKKLRGSGQDLWRAPHPLGNGI
jgi:hypothetical protein